GSCAHTTSPSAESHTSVSRPLTPASSARANAGIEFSRSSSRAPRCANVIGVTREPRGHSPSQRPSSGPESRGAGRLVMPEYPGGGSRAHVRSSTPGRLPKGRSVPTQRIVGGSNGDRDGDRGDDDQGQLPELRRHTADG